MDGPYTRALAEYISTSAYRTLPASVVEHAKLLVLDTLGIGIYGTSLPWSGRHWWRCFGRDGVRRR